MREPRIVPYPASVVLTSGEYPGDPAAPENRRETLRPAEYAPEEYKLVICPDKIEVEAGTNKGLFYARQTLRQLSGAGGAVACMEIRDKPFFPYRGFLLDSARHITGLGDIKTLVDAAALFKMNTFHWHLTDDQGWRIPVDRYPLLTEKGAVRLSSDFGKVHTGKPYGGFYTKSELREIVAYCAERHIDVIPEIDMPGHMTAAISAYPELSCSGKQIPVQTRQGIFPDILCAGKDSTLETVFGILDELLDIFPSKSIHIGGDEAPKDHWKLCPACQKRIADEGLADEEELQCWFVGKICGYLRQKGRAAVVWNESLKGGVPCDDMTVEMWMDRKALCPAFANNGGKLIVSPFFYYYMDYPYAMTPLKKTYRFNPFVKGLDARGRSNVLGVEGSLWTEHIRDYEKLCTMAYPRFAAIAETGWTPPQQKNYQDFKDRYDALLPLLNAGRIVSPPRKDWDPNPLKRIAGTCSFFGNNFGRRKNANSRGIEEEKA